jgi:hypothetical protein
MATRTKFARLTRIWRGESHFSQMSNVGKSGEFVQHSLVNAGESGEYSPSLLANVGASAHDKIGPFKHK